MKRSEEALQRALIATLRAVLQKPWLVFHVSNGGGRSKAEAGSLKAMGVLAGVPDLMLVGPQIVRERNAATQSVITPRIVAIELKAPPKQLKTRISQAKPNVTDAQRDVIETLGRCGIPTLIVRDLDEALRALAELGVPLKGRLM